MQLYEYNGSVMVYDRCVESFWKARTMAVSEAAARRNLAFQYKKQTGRTATVPVNLPDKLKLIS